MGLNSQKDLSLVSSVASEVELVYLLATHYYVSYVNRKQQQYYVALQNTVFYFLDNASHG